ncbi:hypothetical protein, partial [Paenibacillus elgii]|uniref:hypothetical protein n=1 Tax=Paenibacillus elgii TaxID=189691 RepID=UPI001E3F2C2A
DCVCWRRPTELREPQGSLAQEEKDASLFARIPHLSAIAQVVGVFNYFIQKYRRLRLLLLVGRWG